MVNLLRHRMANNIGSSSSFWYFSFSSKCSGDISTANILLVYLRNNQQIKTYQAFEYYNVRSYGLGFEFTDTLEPTLKRSAACLLPRPSATITSVSNPSTPSRIPFTSPLKMTAPSSSSASSILIRSRWDRWAARLLFLHFLGLFLKGHKPFVHLAFYVVGVKEASFICDIRLWKCKSLTMAMNGIIQNILINITRNYPIVRNLIGLPRCT
jgi:hypothetical protein